MTTIASDGKTMAGDSLVCVGSDVLTTTEVKVFELRDGRVVGFSGTTYQWGEMIDFLNGDQEELALPGEDSLALIMLHDGSLVVTKSDGSSWPVKPPYAIGNGANYAIGAMLAGAPPVEAIRIAAARDVWTGGDRIDVRCCAERAPVLTLRQQLNNYVKKWRA